MLNRFNLLVSDDSEVLVCSICNESSSYSFVSCEVSVMSGDVSGFKCKPKLHSCAPSEELMIPRLLK